MRLAATTAEPEVGDQLQPPQKRTSNLNKTQAWSAQNFPDAITVDPTGPTRVINGGPTLRSSPDYFGWSYLQSKACSRLPTYPLRH
uniref:Uncharacterized protein n=1 Tax=Ditylenchus dipsaci TaxID=166011 RepID=A0A915DC60_9BILA